MNVDGGHLKLTMNALGKAMHVRVAVPVELMAGRNYHKEKCKLSFHLDW